MSGEQRGDGGKEAQAREGQSQREAGESPDMGTHLEAAGYRGLAIPPCQVSLQPALGQLSCLAN